MLTRFSECVRAKIVDSLGKPLPSLIAASITDADIRVSSFQDVRLNPVH